MLTAYDVSMAEAMNDAVDMILVGDSVAMVVLGHDSTVAATMDDMVRHTAAVARGAKRPLLVADMPFGSYASVAAGVANAHRLVAEGGAHAVKLEGGVNQAAKIAAIVAEGIPVVAHIGLTPQTATLSSGYRVQGRQAAEAMRLVEDALAVQAAGAFAVVVEKVPAQLAAFLSSLLAIPTIGIGAGPACDGQVLVAHDLLGLYPRMVPKFVRQYAQLLPPMKAAFAKYADDVASRRFPPPLPSAPPLATEVATPPAASAANTYRYDMTRREAEAFAVEVEHLRAVGSEAVAATSAATAAGGRGKAAALLAAVPAHRVEVATAALRAAAPHAGMRQEGVALSHLASPTTSTTTTRASGGGGGPRVAIIGSGALASVLAARLASSGALPVTMFTRDRAAVAAVTTHGIAVQAGAAGAIAPGVPCPIVDLATWPQFVDLVALLRAAAGVATAAPHDATPRTRTPSPDTGAALHSQHAGAYDAVIIANKATSAVSALAAAMLLVRQPRTGGGGGGGGVVIPLYNGGFTLEYGRLLFSGGLPGAVGAEAAAAVRGVAPWQLAYGVTYHAATAPSSPAQSSARILRATAAVHVAAAPPHVVHASEGSSLVTALEPEAGPVLRALAPLLSDAGMHTTCLPDGVADALRASKLAVNAILNPLAALTGVRNGDALTIATRRPGFVTQLAAEVAAVIAPHVPAMQAHVPGCAGFDGSPEECVARAMRGAAATADNTSSMLADAQRGRVCEAQFLCGWVAHSLVASGAAPDGHRTSTSARLLRHFNDRDRLLFADDAAHAAALDETNIVMRSLRVPTAAGPMSS